MGYADTIPFVSISSAVANTYTTYLPLTTVEDDHIDFFRFYTLDYKKPINYAYATLIVPVRVNTNANPNYINSAAAYLRITDSVTSTNINCGAIPLYDLYVLGSQAAYGNYEIPLATNIAASLTPNRLYYCALMDIKSKENNLNVIMPRVEIKMFGNI